MPFSPIHIQGRAIRTSKYSLAMARGLSLPTRRTPILLSSVLAVVVVLGGAATPVSASLRLAALVALVCLLVAQAATMARREMATHRIRRHSELQAEAAAVRWLPP